MLMLRFLSRCCRDAKSLFIAAFVAFLIFCISSPSHSQEKPLRVAMWGEYMPLHGFVNGEAVGLEADLAREIGKKLNRKVVFVDTRSKGMSSINAVARGEADIALNAITPTPERAQLVGFTKPYVTLHYRVLSTPVDGFGSSIDLTTVEDLRNKKVVAPEGPALAALREIVGENAISAPTMRAAIDMLKNDKVDLVFGEEVGLIVAGQGTDFILTGPSLGKADIAAAVPKTEVMRYDKLLQEINSAITILTTKWQPRLAPESTDGVRIDSQYLRPTLDTLLWSAATACKVAEVKALFDAGANSNGIKSNRPIFQAIVRQLEQCDQVVDLFLAHGADPNGFARGIPPIETARKFQRTYMIERLLKAGAKDYAALIPNCSEAANAAQNRDRNMRMFSVYVLKNCGADAVAPLSTLVRDEDEDIVIFASGALLDLQKKGVNVAMAIPSLKAMLNRQNVGLYVAGILSRIDPASQKDVDATYMRYLDDLNPHYQARAVEYLGEKIPPKKLIQLLTSDDIHLRECSARALKKNSAAINTARHGVPKLESCGIQGLMANCFDKPCEFFGDFDDDKKLDMAQLVSRGAPGSKGIAFLFGSGRCIVIGAGGDNYGDLGGLALDEWRLVPNPRGKGTAIEISQRESNGALIYWRKGKFYWKHHGD